MRRVCPEVRQIEHFSGLPVRVADRFLSASGDHLFPLNISAASGRSRPRMGAIRRSISSADCFFPRRAAAIFSLCSGDFGTRFFRLGLPVSAIEIFAIVSGDLFLPLFDAPILAQCSGVLTSPTIPSPPSVRFVKSQVLRISAIQIFSLSSARTSVGQVSTIRRAGCSPAASSLRIHLETWVRLVLARCSLNRRAGSTDVPTYRQDPPGVSKK